MKNYYILRMLSIVAFLTGSFTVNAQCDINPTITGNILLCDESDVTLSTQAFDSYQWYRREWYWDPSVTNPNPWIEVEGAINQTLTVSGADDFLHEFKVAATLNNCTEESPLVLIDSYAYGLPFMISNFEPGTFLQINDLEYNICNGASVVFENGYPAVYGLHTWFHCIPSSMPAEDSDACIIPGIIGDTYTANTNGNYGFYACTEYCPNLCEFLGSNGFIKLNFGDFEFCSLGTEDPNSDTLNIGIYPNPATQFLSIMEVTNITKGDFTITDTNGKIIKQINNMAIQTMIDVSGLSAGIYTISLRADGKNYRNKFIKK